MQQLASASSRTAACRRPSPAAAQQCSTACAPGPRAVLQRSSASLSSAWSLRQLSSDCPSLPRTVARAGFASPSPSAERNGFGPSSPAASASATLNAPTDAPSSASQPADAKPSTPLIANLLLQCQDQKGVVAAISQLLYGLNCNILSSDQFTDQHSNMFFQRISFDFSDILVGPGNTAVLERAIAELAVRFNMQWKISYRNKVKRMAIFVSKQDHCLYDLLIRHKAGELERATIPVVVSNHPDLKHIADTFGVPFRCLPIDKANKAAQEQAVEDVIKEYDIDLLILARYMQIFSPAFCERHWRHTINIHHSFLPAFEGARPYHRAHERGVKIIGATAHFATSELDAGPIVDQGTARISHRDSVDDMIRKGKDLERLVLARAVRWVVDDRVMVHGNKTIVFD